MRSVIQGRGERLTPYQSEYPNPIITTHTEKEVKKKTVADKIGARRLDQ